MKKNIFSAIAIFAVLIIFAFIAFYDAPESDEKSAYTLTEDSYEADDWSETVEYDGYTVTKNITMGAPSVIVEFMNNRSPVTVTITRGSKTTLVYSADRTVYDMYISYRNDNYIISENFSNLDTIVSFAFDWSEDTCLGTYGQEFTTDENGNTLYTDENGNTSVYRYEDEI